MSQHQWFTAGFSPNAEPVPSRAWVPRGTVPAPGAPSALAPLVPPPSMRLGEALLKLAIIGGAAYFGVQLAAALFAGGRRRTRRTDLDANAARGARFERRVERFLERAHPGAEILSQVYVTTTDGRARVVDNVVLHPNGVVKTVEAKDVDVLRREHAQQALDHADGVQRALGPGARVGRPQIAVPQRTEVPASVASYFRAGGGVIVRR